MKKSCPREQRGSTLLIGIVVLIVLMALGISGASHSWLESRMTSNYVSQQDLFHYAEAALKEGRAQTIKMDLASLGGEQPKGQLLKGGTDANTGAGNLIRNPEWSKSDPDHCPAGEDKLKQYCLVNRPVQYAQDFSESRTYKLFDDDQAGKKSGVRVRWYALYLMDGTQSDPTAGSTHKYSGQSGQRYYEINARADRGDGTPAVSLRAVVKGTSQDSSEQSGPTQSNSQ